MSARVEIRNATAFDSPFLGWVMLTAARSHRPKGLWDHLLDVPQTERLAILSAYARSSIRHAGHHSRFRIATVDGEIAAAVAAYGGDEVTPEDNADALIESLLHRGWDGSRVDALIQRTAEWSSLDLPEQAGAWRLEWVATLPLHRRRGVAQFLLMDAISAGTAAGHRCTELRVALGNNAAIRVYQQLGFEVRSTHLDAAMNARFGTAGVVRMQRLARAPQRCVTPVYASGSR